MVRLIIIILLLGVALSSNAQVDKESNYTVVKTEYYRISAVTGDWFMTSWTADVSYINISDNRVLITDANGVVIKYKIDRREGNIIFLTNKYTGESFLDFTIDERIIHIHKKSYRSLDCRVEFQVVPWGK